jgi:hypothetical protein
MLTIHTNCLCKLIQSIGVEWPTHAKASCRTRCYPSLTYRRQLRGCFRFGACRHQPIGWPPERQRSMGFTFNSPARSSRQTPSLSILASFAPCLPTENSTRANEPHRFDARAVGLASSRKESKHFLFPHCGFDTYQSRAFGSSLDD